MPRRNATKSNRWVKVLIWTLAVLFVLGAVGCIVAQALLNQYLRSAKFREDIEQRSGINLRAKIEIAPVRFEGSQFFCDSFRAQGADEASFSELRVDAIRGELNLPSILKVIFGSREFKVHNVEVQKLALDFYRDRIPVALLPRGEYAHSEAIESLTIRDVTVGWPGGGIKGAVVRATNVDGGWKIEGSGGRLTQLGFPAFQLTTARLMFKRPSLFVQDAHFTHDGGEINVSGEINSRENADLLLNLRDVNITPMLPEDWRARLHGRLGGEVRLKMPLKDGTPKPPSASGRLELRNGMLEALPVLAKIAEFTKTDNFRRIPLHTLSADFRYDATGLHVSNLILESKQLIVLRGGFTVKNETVDGTFDVGITPGPLQFLPGSQEKVFNTAGAGYVWTKMRISGPVGALKEDLTPRLVAAATAVAVEKVQNTATEAVGTAVDTAKKAADLILSPLFGN